jgi:putative endonuclease
MFFVYILYSIQADRYYVGETDSLGERLISHKTGISPYTSMANDWELKYHEEFGSRKEAIKREKQIKRKKSRKYIEWLISR